MMIRKAVFSLVLVALAGVSLVGSAQAAAIAKRTHESTIVGAKAGVIPPTSSVQDLEAALKHSYIGTYAIYGALPDEYKTTLYSSIKDGGNIQDFRNQVIKMRLHRH
ncbi:hypothetical protein [Thiolapillus brandeum]|nr:hypothetical protein [Thiolapillus brandeum]